jgi:translocation and assembly module TamB
MELQLQGRLLDSLLRGYPLTGQVDARMRDNELELAALELNSKGTMLNARGVLSQRIDFQASVAELSAWLPQGEGALQGDGWVRWQNEELGGAVQGSGRNIRYGDLTLKSVDFAAEQRSAKGQGQLKLQVGQLQVADLPAIDGRMQVLGTLESHQADASLNLGADTSIELSLAGGYQQEKWQGSLQRLALEDKTGPFRLLRPTAVTVSPRNLHVDELQLQGTAEEELSAAADLQLQPLSGQLRGQWRQIDLARANPWLPSYKLSGQSSGQVDLKLPEGGAPDLAARVELNGRLVQEHLSVGLQRGLAELAWNRSGLEGQIQLQLEDGGRLEGHCRSPEPAAARLPHHVQWQLDWQALDLGRLQPFLPAGVTVAGQLGGKASGDWASEGVFSATGSAAIEGGRLVGTVGEGRLTLLLKSGTFDWDWHDRQLQSGVSLVLEEYGRLEGQFQLPLPARLPLAFEEQGALNATLAGKLQETGLVTVLFPGVLQEAHGQLEIDLAATGQWNKPLLRGRLGLKEAGAYVPSAGIELKDITLQAELAGDQVKLNSFSVHSGKGLLQGQGSLQLQDWQLASYTATLEGDGFELVRLPELQLSVSPRLSLQGTLQGVEVSGALTVPEMLLRGATQTTAEGPSEDVIIVSQELLDEPAEPFALKADVELLFGDHMLVKAKGLDARLTGRLELAASALDQVRAKGRISIAEGKFSAYGAKLDIQRGLLMFNGPVETPTLDILALRVLRNVKAGVRVTGTAKEPIITLYSEPAMSDSDRLAYIVLGRPLARDSGEAALMMTAAGALLSEGESAVLQDRLKRTLGLDVIGFEEGDDEGDPAGSLLTIGKYLSPNLFVSYGKSLFTETSEFRMRYSLGEHWELESMTGAESGVDLLYKIEFR